MIFRKLLAPALLVFGFALPAQAIEVQRVVSDKGIEAWLVEDHTNPIIALSMAFRGGAAMDPQDRAGLANMASGLIDEGAGEMTSQDFQEMLENNAISLSFTAGQDSFQGSLRSLTANRDMAFDLLRLALTEPRFDDEPVERIRNQILVSLKREQQDPTTVAFREWYRTVFPDHPYGTPVKGKEDSVQAITQDDLRAFVERSFARDRLLVGVVGDVTPDELKILLDKTFGDLPDASALPEIPKAQPRFGGPVRVVEQDNPQSVAVFGEDGIDRQDPDFYAAYVLNYVLGGGSFASRLMEEVREKRGLAYSVYTYLQSLEGASLLAGSVATANARLTESLDLIREEWRKMSERGITEEELANAKTYLTGSFPLQLDSTSSIAAILTSIQMDELGIDYLDKRNDYINAVTGEDIARVAQRMLDPSKLTVVVVGNPDGLMGTQ